MIDQVREHYYTLLTLTYGVNLLNAPVKLHFKYKRVRSCCYEMKACKCDLCRGVDIFTHYFKVNIVMYMYNYQAKCIA